jgi:diguanylate cyclase (GGDEF)-like protein
VTTEKNPSPTGTFSSETLAFADSFPVMILECDQCGEIVFASSRTKQILDFNTADTYPSMFGLISKNENDKLDSVLKSVFNGYQPVKDEFVFLTKNGIELPFYAIIESKAGIARWIIIDISRISSFQKKMLETERRHKALVEHAIHQALHDSLTGLFNKEMFFTRLEVELMKGAKRRARGSRIAITCIGLDGFKKINDIYGTHIGDAILQHTAKRLQNTVRGDDIVARFDGDKFMVLFTEIASSDDVPLILRKIFTIFSDPFEVEKESIIGSVSIGISIFPDDTH